MQTKLPNRLITLLALAAVLSASGADLGTAFTYQGRLVQDGNAPTGVYDFTFRLYTDPAAGTAAGPGLTNTAVAVQSGLFATRLDFGPGVFNGTALWLEIGVRTNTSAGVFTALTPRQPVAPAPQALYAPVAGAAAQVAPGGVTTAAIAPGAVDSTRIADGSVSGNDLSPVLRTNTFWGLQGNAGTSSGTFVGTTDTRPLRLKVNGYTGWRLEPAWFYPNVIGGTENNLVHTYGTVIGGGINNLVGTNSYYSLIGGGSGNTIGTNSFHSVIGGGGGNSLASEAPWSVIHGGGYHAIGYGSDSAVIGGGYMNKLGSHAFSSTIGGGLECTVGDNASSSTIGGGYGNRVLDGAYGSTIGGGHYNTNGGQWSMVPGGAQNAALGHFSLAAGHQAKAVHEGAFVWADAQWADFASTGPNQFLIRASGGVGINKTNPAAALDVEGTVRAREFNTQGPVQMNENDLYFRSSDLFHGLGWYGNPRYFGGVNVNGPVLYGFGGGALGYTGNGTNVALLWNASGNVGIGRNDPASKLDVNGTITATGYRGAAGQAISIGTTDAQAIELVLNNQRAWRLEPGASNSVNVLGGWSGNAIGAGLIGVTIAGGGSMKLGDDRVRVNHAYANFSTISGGSANRVDSGGEDGVIGGGFRNRIFSGQHAAIGGGYGNTIDGGALCGVIAGGWINSLSGPYSTIAGGYLNRVVLGAYDAAIGGGANNEIQTWADGATIAGGFNNVVQTNARAATIAGGTDNSAASYAFAAGSRAKANHTGTFVWSDTSWGDFASTGSNQFLVRATAGVGINKANPASALDVNGTVTANGLYASGSATISGGLSVGSGLWVGGGITAGDHLRVGDRQIYLRGGGDTFHGLGWYSTGSFAGANPDGPVLYGCAGGTLGTLCGGPSWALTWNSIGNVAVRGTLSQQSDRESKTDFAGVDSGAILEKVAALPVGTWRYRSEAEGVRHLGPVAQDFHAAFGLGENNTSITTVDQGGVALAAIQGLNRKLEEKNAALQREVDELKTLVQTLARRMEAGGP